VRLSGELFPEALLPSNLPAFGFEAGEVTIRAQGVNEISVNSRSGTGLRVFWVLIGIPYITEARGPDDFSILSGESLDKLVIHAAIAHQIKPRSNHRRA
jgi:hypothetical protein